MANAGLVIFGMILLAGMFYLANVYVTPQQKEQLALAEQACNFNIWGVPVGSIGQALSPDIAQKCEQVRFAKQIMSFQIYAYGLGFLLLVIGLVTGGKKEVHIVREVKKSAHKEEKEESEEVEGEEKPKKGKKFCSECGNPVSLKDKFCKKCGNKI